MQRPVSDSSPQPDVPASAQPLGRRGSTRPQSGRAGHLNRRSVGVLAGVVGAAWLIAVLGGAVSEANSLAARHAREQAINDQLRARVEAGREAIAYLKTTPFLSFESRAYGMGAAGEHPFALETNAPPPPSITPLGGTATPAPPPDQLDDWLNLLLAR
jgi:hypothetical protein